MQSATIPRPLEVLIAEDEPAVRNVIALVLRQRGHHVTTARGCDDALARLAEQRYDVVLADVRMPGDGPALRQVLGSRVPETRVFLMSGATRPEVEPGMGWISKPFDFEALVRRVEEGC